MKLEIEGLLRGRDVGYSVRHPDHNHLDEFCCCENRHIHIPGETPTERHRYACLMIAAHEMFELIQRLAVVWEGSEYPCTDIEQAFELVSRLDHLAAQASQLLAKIEGGEK